MAISNQTADQIVNGADHAFHGLVRGGMLRHARTIRDTTDGTVPERHGQWARRVMAGADGSYPAIIRELSLRQAMQDLYAAGGPYDTAAENTVKSNIGTVLDAVLAAQGR